MRRAAFGPAILAALLVLAALPALRAEERGALALEPPRDLRLAFSGWVGERLEKNVDRWLLEAPEANPGMLEMFRVRDRKPVPSLVPWAGEFAGKYLDSAVLAIRATGREDLRERVRAFVEELIATQAEDGYLGPFPRGERLLGNWDLWGHYHVIWGLLLYHELAGEGAAFEAALKAADLVAATYLDGPRRVIDAGAHEMNMAIIHALVRLYRLSGRERYLRLAREIERDWESAGDYLRQGLAGVEFYETPRPRWESLHDIQGLAELYRVTGDERYRTALSNLWRSIRAKDRHNTGGFSTGEQAVGDPYAPGAIETCSTVAWVALSADQLQLTGDPAVADELEVSTLNGILGAQHPSGRWWTYSTPMDGVREASAHAIVFQARAGTPELNCCSVHGPRGLAGVAEWAVLSKGPSVTLSYYGPLRASLALPSGTRLELEEATSYPAGDGTVEIAVRPEREEEFELRLRIPEWSEKSFVALRGGERRAARPGSYCVLKRRWRPGDGVRLELDLRLRVVPGARAQAGKVSLYRGPLLLAYDQGLNRFDPDEIPPVDAAAVAGLSLPEARPPERGVRPFLAVEVPTVAGAKLRLSDFASAGAAARLEEVRLLIL
ncbi:MAG: beta-L-arabinofuranosidase domain-containing protein, partial [Planctomycetota bacterium]